MVGYGAQLRSSAGEGREEGGRLGRYECMYGWIYSCIYGDGDGDSSGDGVPLGG